MESELFNTIHHILRTPPMLRTTKQLKVLSEFLSQLSFFKTYIVPVGEEILFKASEYVSYEFFSEGSFIFNFGDVGNKFYVVLQGQARVLIPKVTDESELCEVNVLGAGASFGEYALLYNQPRLASIQCGKDTHLAVLSKESYLQILGKIENKRIDDTVKLLRSFQIFKNWSKTPIVKISYFFTERAMSRKTVLFKEGDPINEVFFIKQGELELLKSVGLDSPEKSKFKKRVRKQNVNVSILSAGEVVGTEVLTDEKYSYTCQVYSLVAKILIISKTDFCSKFKNEESQKIMKRNNESKEKERQSRVSSLERIRNIGREVVEEKVVRPVVRVYSKSPKHFSESPTRKKFTNLSENHLKRIISRSRIDINCSESPLNTHYFSEIKPKTGNSSLFHKRTHNKYMYPIRIEQKQLIDRYKTPEVPPGRYFYL